MERGGNGELSLYRISARGDDLAFLQGILEASEGLGVIHGERGGEVLLETPSSRSAAVEELLEDLRRERGVEAELIEVRSGAEGEGIGSGRAAN